MGHVDGVLQPAEPLGREMDDAGGRDENLRGEQTIARAQSAGAEHGARRERPAFARHDDDERCDEERQRGDGPEQAWVVEKGVQLRRYVCPGELTLSRYKITVMPHRHPGSSAKSGPLSGKPITFYRPKGSQEVRHLIDEGFPGIQRRASR